MSVAGAAVGGAAGGIVGALTDSGIDERDAHVYAEGVRRGGTLVVAKVNDARAPEAPLSRRPASLSRTSRASPAKKAVPRMQSDFGHVSGAHFFPILTSNSVSDAAPVSRSARPARSRRNLRWKSTMTVR